ncbi:MAG: hypothetical protein ACRCUM_02535 [Mycoplasmoidaceae bacterium]
MVKSKKIHKNISLSETVMNEALKQAEKLFSSNFSMYLTYLINKDIGVIKENNFITLGTTPVPTSEETTPVPTSEETTPVPTSEETTPVPTSEETTPVSTSEETTNQNTFLPLDDIDNILNN